MGRVQRAFAWWREERGSAAAEVTLVAPILVMLLVFVAIVIHRGVDARLRLDDAAHQAARAASLQRTEVAATTSARSIAADALANAGLVCIDLGVTISGNLEPGTDVAVTISCTVDLSDALPVVAGSRRLAATAIEPVDTWRAGAIVGSSG